MFPSRLVWTSVLGSLAWFAPAVPLAAGEVDFNRDIRPILSDHCFFCHGPDESTREAGLRLDDRDEAISYAAIAPGDPDGSELVNRIDHADAAWIMPPPESHKTLTSVQKDLLRRWIQDGAAYEPHWSFTPIQRPATPLHPIDSFVRQRLVDVGADLSPPARGDRLVRRLHLDLTGLPPSWSQVQSFVRDFDVDPDAAVMHTIEDLMRSPHHGERMASFWLDVVRYADTVGFHGDQNQNVFPYRDWVVDAFNQNMPFDEFTIAQLAGDLKPHPTTEDLIASGFNRLNMMTREGGAQPGEYLTKYASDRVRTVGMAWMGLTTGCAECHDHKFDPFTAKDFYSLGAFFADVTQWGVYSDYGYTPNADLRGFNNDFPFPPEIEITSDALLRQQTDVYRSLIQMASAAGGDNGAFESWRATTEDWLVRHPRGWARLNSTPVEPAPSDKPPKSHSWTITADDSPMTSIRVNLRPRGSQPSRSVQAEFAIVSARGDRKVIKPVMATANRWLPGFSSGQVIHDVARGWKIPATDDSGRVRKERPQQYVIDDAAHVGDPMSAAFQFRRPLKIGDGDTIEIILTGAESFDAHFESSPVVWLRPHDPMVASWSADPTAGHARLIHRLTFPAQAKPSATKDSAAWSTALSTYRSSRDGRTLAMVTQATQPYPTRVLPRGNWQDQSGEIVMPAVPAFLGTLGIDGDESGDGGSGRRWTRMDLANWLVHPDNPLTARVVVNRLWKQFFGQGLTIAADDLGTQGDPPSHPECLDYLAGELIDSGWDIRHVVRLILTCDTYRQDSRAKAELQTVDPENRLLAFHPPRRLEAEVVRDNALSIAGLLNPRIGGPATRPYQPGGYYSNLQFPDRDYAASIGDDQYRRGLYMHWQRTFLHPMLANFDAPSREDCVAIRSTANTPQQALTLLNDPTFLEAAGQFAYNALTTPEATDEASRVRWMIRQCLQRDGTSDEIDRLLALIDQQQAAYAADPESVASLDSVGQSSSRRDWPAVASSLTDRSQTDPSPDDVARAKVRWAAWTTAARVLLNLHETITRY